jgi:hypothetical protein
MGVLNDRLALVLAAKGRERAKVRQCFEEQIATLEHDKRRGWIENGPEFDTLIDSTKVRWAEQYAAIEAKYEMTLEVLKSMEHDLYTGAQL